MSSIDLVAGNDGFGSDVLKLLALLRLNSIDNSTSTAAAAAATPRTPFSLAAARSKKTRSYSSSPCFRKSLSRRAKLHSSATRNRPLSLIPPSLPPLRDPSIAETTNVSDSSVPQFLKSENLKNDDISSFTHLPVLPRPLRHSLSGSISSETQQQAAAQAAPPSLRRSTSDPIASESYQVPVAAADTLPEPPAAARTLSRFPTSDQDFRDEYGKESGEALWIDQIYGGGGLIIHFKCPCGEAYEILLSGNTCYYKLM